MMQLEDFGWNDTLRQKWQDFADSTLVPARVTADFGTSLRIVLPKEATAELSGKLAHYTAPEFMPKVGDWVAVQPRENSPAVIEAVLSRRSEIARKAAGDRTVKQVLAANIDIAFVLLALDNDFSVERLRRFLYQLSINAISPVIVLNKADKTHDIESCIVQLRAFELPIVTCVATTGKGVDEIRARVTPGVTAILLGSSGVGKSTLTNQLLGRDAQTTQAVRSSDSTGKHTTVHRELFVLPGGGMLIDTPGIRELQLWGTTSELDENFDDIMRLVAQCRYRSCQHGSEEGCAVRTALQSGELSANHYASYLKMKAELIDLKEKNIVKLKKTNSKSRSNTAKRSRDMLRDAKEELNY